jgi:FkbM family methyltransferase
MITSLRTKLERLLGEEVAVARKRERTVFDELAFPFENSIVLYGAGSLGKRTLMGLRNLGIEPHAFVDRNPSLWSSQVEGIQVLSPQKGIERYEGSAVFVVAIWNPEMGQALYDARKCLESYGSPKVVSFVPLFYKYAEVFLPYYSLDLPHKILTEAGMIISAFDLLGDELSCETYVSYIEFRLKGDLDKLIAPANTIQYFPDDILCDLCDEVFIDCGAYNGDTLEQYLMKYRGFSAYIAFEPDPSNFLQLLNFLKHLEPGLRAKINCYQLGVSDSNKTVYFQAKGTAGSSVGDGNMEIKCCSLDEEIGSRKPTYIKMDIEGSEMSALWGAKRCIEESLPILAVCVYHRPRDLWRIPLLINSFNDSYAFYLRSHEYDGWDIVCYAVPKNR